jgi:hypothetical protein
LKTVSVKTTKGLAAKVLQTAAWKIIELSQAEKETMIALDAL